MRLITAVAELNRADDPAAGGGPGQITTVALYTDPDATAWFVQEADEAVGLGSATYLDPRDGHRKSRYLDEDGVVSALVAASCDAVWVGWGFVSERPSFARHCEDAGITFVGPDSETIRSLGDKVQAKRLAERADVPVVPWSGGPVDDPAAGLTQAAVLGYPVMLKASAGGGGRGIRLVRSAEELAGALASARNEAELAFGDPSVFMEAYVDAARHVEVQIIADSHGTAWAVGVRDCSVQRRNQKVIEESASTALDERTDTEIRAAAVRIAQAAGYVNAGTVEFLVDPDTKHFLFMEVNTRLQVEHPVTEATTGLDLVKLQLLVAAGGRLEGDPPPVNGHAVEARLNAEDPEHGFAPAPGRITMLRLASGSGVRVDSGVREHDTVSSDFDSMIAKVIAWGRDRDEALARLRRALAQSAVIVEGGTTNRTFLLTLLDTPQVRSGEVDNRWLDRLTATDQHLPAPTSIALLVAAVEAYNADHAAVEAQFHAGARRGRPERPERTGSRLQLRYAGTGYDLEVYRTSPGSYRVKHGGTVADVGVSVLNDYERRVSCGGKKHRVIAQSQEASFRVVVDDRTHRIDRDDGGVVRAGWPAFVVSIAVAPGDVVAAGDPVAVLESMKMESTVTAPYAGEVAAVEVVTNVQVGAGAPLLRIKQAKRDLVVTGEALDLSGLEAKTDPHEPLCERVYGKLRSFLLGYDLDPAMLHRLLVEQRRLGEVSPPADPGLLSCEDGLLDLYAEVVGLYRPRTETDPDAALTESSTQEYLLGFLQWLDADRAGLSEDYRTRLQRFLAHYGVDTLDRTSALHAAVVWMFRSFSRVSEVAPLVLSILARRLHAGPGFAALADDQMRARLDRLAAAALGRQHSIAELARDVRFRYFDEPVLEALVAEEYAATDRILDELAADPASPQRDTLIQRMVESTHPQRGRLLLRWRETEDRDLRAALLEIYARRFYRIRGLSNLHVVEHQGRQLCLADYDVDNRHIRLAIGFVALDEVPALCRVLATHLDAASTTRQVTLDLLSWRSGEQPEIDQTAVEVEVMLGECSFGCRPWRVDLTITSLGGDRPEHRRTQHLTYRPRAGGR